MNFYWHLFDFPLPMNFLQLYFTVLIYQFLGLLVITSMTSLISYYTKSSFTTLSLSLGLFFLPQLMLQVFKEGIINKLLTFCPIANNDIELTLLKLSNSEGFIFSNFYLNYGAIIIVMIMMVIIFNFIIIKKQNVKTTY
ncbi:hypothetical protein SPB_1078 [Streptococcus parauberis NCFD 2020]|uniref:ABC-2 type transporter domain-containing protein n=1 Tax=Streptococcus parauberis NCFD 2020 TaxID=873447 RepID=F1Z2L0_9STRE|nr:hypothetical protein SPB_1078 [Streptococcus parauberis NCFD 2020]